jgi:hypothetical protein
LAHISNVQTAHAVGKWQAGCPATCKLALPGKRACFEAIAFIRESTDRISKRQAFGLQPDARNPHVRFDDRKFIAATIIIPVKFKRNPSRHPRWRVPARSITTERRMADAVAAQPVFQRDPDTSRRRDEQGV